MKFLYQLILATIVTSMPAISVMADGGSPNEPFADGAAARDMGPSYTCVPRAAAPGREASGGHLEVTTQSAGQLAELLGENVYALDSLTVTGPVNGDDIRTLWSASFYGRLRVLDLGEAVIGELPEYAFYCPEEQVDFDNGVVYTIWLEEITLPDTLEKIGRQAFAYAVSLKKVCLGPSLREIGSRAFSDCVSLSADPLVLPERLETVGEMAFFNCRSLTGEVVLPSSVRTLCGGAFYSAKISGINFPEGLERIGDAAFYGCMLREVSLPGTCLEMTGSDHFALNHELERLSLPEGLGEIPAGFADDCLKLREVGIPQTVRRIGPAAFGANISLPGIELPEGLETIDPRAFEGCSYFVRIVFPSTLKSIGVGSCSGWNSIQAVYSAAAVPPVCVESAARPGETPFIHTRHDTPLYVPVGSSEAYRNAWGWNHFSNIIETDEFPSAGVEAVGADDACAGGAFYDLFGRIVRNPVKGTVYIRNGRKILCR